MITKAAKCVGSRVALARALGVTKAAVWQWEHERPVPSEYCPSIERLTGGAVRCEDLRPEVDWGYLRGTSAAVTDKSATTEEKRAA